MAGIFPAANDWKEFNDWLRIDGNGGPGPNVPNKIRGEDSSSGFDALYAGNWGYGVFTGELAAFWSSTELLMRREIQPEELTTGW
jgi:hypothetical protein